MEKIKTLITDKTGKLISYIFVKYNIPISIALIVSTLGVMVGAIITGNHTLQIIPLFACWVVIIYMVIGYILFVRQKEK